MAPNPEDMCKCGQIFVSPIHSGVVGGHAFELAKIAEPDNRELVISRLMNKIGETHTLTAEHFIKLWPKEDPALIRAAIERLKSPVAREGRPR